MFGMIFSQTCSKLYILSQSSNATRKRPQFFTTNGCRAIYVGEHAQLISKNLYRTENMLSGVWFCELLSDWSKILFGSRDLVSGHKVKKSIFTHTPTLGQLVFFSSKIVLLNFTKLSVKFILTDAKLTHLFNSTLCLPKHNSTVALSYV